VLRHHIDRGAGAAVARFIHLAIGVGTTGRERNGTEMARPQTGGFTPKAGKERNSGPDKMRMSHLRMRRDIKRIEAEQAKAAAVETVKPGRK
jgi:hypothetical protein